jgi:hypothetical protein
VEEVVRTNEWYGFEEICYDREPGVAHALVVELAAPKEFELGSVE